MPQNVGSLDRALRAFVAAPAAVVGAVLFGAATVAGIVLLVFAGIMLVTAGTRFCPTYTLLGISTEPRAPHRVPRRLRRGHA